MMGQPAIGSQFGALLVPGGQTMRLSIVRDGSEFIVTQGDRVSRWKPRHETDDCVGHYELHGFERRDLAALGKTWISMNPSARVGRRLLQ